MKATIKLYHFLKKEKPHIVHTHTPKAGIVGMLAAYLAHVPIRLHTVAGLPLMEAKGFKRFLLNTIEKLTYRFATNVYPNSHGLHDYIIQQKFTNAKKLKVIGHGSSNGIDTDYFNPENYTVSHKLAFRESLNIPKEDYVFIFVGRIVKDKGITELVEAFVQLYDKHKHISLLLVGPLEEDLDPLPPEIMKSINSHPKIYSVGYQVDVRPHFAISDALVFPSYREGFPNVVMQAGAMGLPAIVSDINGCNEIIIHKENGLIIPVKNTGATVEAMKDVLNDETIFKNCREFIVKNYNRSEIWDSLLQEYKHLEKSLL